MLTLEDLGVLRAVEHEGDRVVVTITPTYSGCPAMATMRDDLVHRLADGGLRRRGAGQPRPAWSSDWITPRGRAALAAARHLAAPARPRTPARSALSLLPTRRAICLSAVRQRPRWR